MNKLMIALMASTLLGGCQSLFGKSAKLEVRPAGAPAEASATIALEEGRQHLARGELGLAVVALSNATLDPASAAEAHNALGVAYARLGRGDLAERYFRRAIELDPADPRFAANLARYYESREAMLAKFEATPPPTGDAPTGTTETPQREPRLVQAGPSVIRIELPTPGPAVTRVSRQEVVIRTAPPAAATETAEARRRNPRFSAATARAKQVAYPMRIDLAAAAGR